MEITNENVLTEISNILLNIGITPNVIGSRYLTMAVSTAIKNPDAVMTITKTIYPIIALEFDTKTNNVERAIRHAIDISWAKNRITNLNQLFGISIFQNKERPTSSELIALLAERIPILIKKK